MALMNPIKQAIGYKAAKAAQDVGPDLAWKQKGNANTSGAPVHNMDIPLDGLKFPMDKRTLNGVQRYMRDRGLNKLSFSGKQLLPENESALQKAVMPRVQDYITNYNAQVGDGRVFLDVDKLSFETDGKTLTVVAGNAKYSDNLANGSSQMVFQRLKNNLTGADHQWSQRGADNVVGNNQNLELFNVALSGTKFNMNAFGSTHVNYQQQAQRKFDRTGRWSKPFLAKDIFGENKQALDSAIMKAVEEHVKKAGVDVANVQAYANYDTILLKTNGYEYQIVDGNAACTK